MATVKITVTLEKEQVRDIQSMVDARRTPNVSAFVRHAVTVALSDAAGWREMLGDALRESGGALTKKETEWADNILSPGHRKRRRRKAA